MHASAGAAGERHAQHHAGAEAEGDAQRGGDEGVRDRRRVVASAEDRVEDPADQGHAERGAHLPPRPDGTYDPVIDGRMVRQGTIPCGRVLRIDPSTWSSGTAPQAEVEEGRPGLLRFADLPAGSKEVEIWLPHDEATELFTLRSNAALEASGHSVRKTWLHHGSSISHGSNARHPTGIWPAMAARLAGVDLLNLGLGGSALLDPFVARTIRDQQADYISVKLGINVVNMDLMRLRGFGPAVHGFLDTIREGHEATPLLVLSPILCPIHEDTPGPSLPVFSGGQLMRHTR
jgi:hypothetical protein